MNRELLLEVKHTILQHHKQFNYHKWLSNDPDMPYQEENVGLLEADMLNHNCGTSGCVAGWTCALGAPSSRFSEVEDTARELLDLNYQEASFLFLCFARFGLDEIDLKKATYEDAIHRINYLLSDEYTKWKEENA